MGDSREIERLNEWVEEESARGTLAIGVIAKMHRLVALAREGRALKTATRKRVTRLNAKLRIAEHFPAVMEEAREYGLPMWPADAHGVVQ